MEPGERCPPGVREHPVRPASLQGCGPGNTRCTSDTPTNVKSTRVMVLLFIFRASQVDLKKVVRHIKVCDLLVIVGNTESK